MKRSFPYVSAVDVLNGQVDPDEFKGSNRLRWDNGTRDARGCRHAARYAVRRGRGAGDGCRQPFSDVMYRPEHGVTLETQHAVIGLGTIIALVVARFGLIWGAIVSMSFLVGRVDGIALAAGDRWRVTSHRSTLR